MLIPTPQLQSDIMKAALAFVNDLMPGDVISEGELNSDPAQRAARAATNLGDAIGKAIDDWLMKVKLIVPPGLPTAGSPPAHVSTAPWEVTKT